MELLVQYLEAHPAPVLYRSADGYNHWDEFINSDESLLCMIGARGTGKTTAMIKRALFKKEKDAIIIVGYKEHRKMIFEQLCKICVEMGYDGQIMRDSDGGMELYANDHTIYVETSIEGYVRSFKSNKQIYYDEPELRRYHDSPSMASIERYRRELNDDVIMIGSIATREMTTFKEFHRVCEQSGYTRKITAHAVPELWISLQQERQHISDQHFRMEYLCDWGTEYREPDYVY